MNLSCGIVGLPNVGKSTLFNALLQKQSAEASNYPFCTIEPNVGVVSVPDNRLEQLASVVNTKKIIPSVIKFVDIAGIIKGAHEGEGLGNKFLAHIREVSLIIHVVRSFEDENVIRTGKSPEEDYDTIITELCLADLQTLEKQKEPKATKDKNELIRWEAIKKLRAVLSEGRESRHADLTEEEKELTRNLFLLTDKPAIHVLNIDEQNYSRADELVKPYEALGWEVVPISAKVEAELVVMDEEEQKEYLNSLGMKETGLERLISKAFNKLGLMSFLTAGEKEVRAWTIKKGAKAPEAAGAIHTDFEKKFIKAQVANFHDFIKFSGWKNLKEFGKVRFEGKEYEMQEDDVVEFMIGA